MACQIFFFYLLLPGKTGHREWYIYTQGGRTPHPLQAPPGDLPIQIGKGPSPLAIPQPSKCWPGARNLPAGPWGFGGDMLAPAQ